MNKKLCKEGDNVTSPDDVANSIDWMAKREFGSSRSLHLLLSFIIQTSLDRSILLVQKRTSSSGASLPTLRVLFFFFLRSSSSSPFPIPPSLNSLFLSPIV